MAERILVIDDQSIVREVLESALVREGFDVVCAESAEDALPLIEQEEFRVIVSDERMPGMSGTKFLAIVRQRHPDTIRIILTGHADIDMAMRAINEEGIYRFFTKPCNMVDLAVTIKQALAHQDLQRENERLTDLVQEQAITLDQLENQCPGITKVKRDADGAVIIDPEKDR